MSRRPASPYASSFSFGPGPISTTLQLLIGANVVMFVAQVLFPIVVMLGLTVTKDRGCLQEMFLTY